MVKLVAYKTIEQHQKEIIDSFSNLSHDRSAMLDYLIDLGNMLIPISSLYKTDNYLIQGCMSKIWLVDFFIENKLFFQADSNTVITKGLISMLLKICSGQYLQDIIEANFYFIEKIKMSSFIGFQRTNGLANMIKALKIRALSRLSLSKINIT